MTYPKAVMRLSELKKMGFPEEYLLQAYRSKNQKFAWKSDTTKQNSPILFDTEVFDKYRMNQVANENLINSHRTPLV